MPKTTSFLRGTALCALFAAGPAFAELPSEIVRADVLPGWRMPSGDHMAAIRLQLAPGWKTYWRAPGESGIPPRFDWDASRNLAAVAAHWPVPDVYFLNGLRNIGYDTVVVVPLQMTPKDASETITISGVMDIGVCEEVCVPVSLNIRAELPPNAATASRDIITASLADRPMTAEEAGVQSVFCRAEPISDGLRVFIDVDMPALSDAEQAVVEFADRTVWVSEAEATRNGNILSVLAEMVPQDATPFAMARSDVRITVFGREEAVDIQGCAGN